MFKLSLEYLRNNRETQSPGTRPSTRPDIFTPVKTSAPVTPLDRCQVECVDPERVRAVLERLPEQHVFQDLAESFRVLAEPGRLRLISALLEAGELCVCDLAAVSNLSQTAVSHNMRLLRSHRLVRYRKQGRNVYYSLDDAHIRLLLEVGLQHVAHETSGRG
jgi:DNA-binding transcriptional ArsR family regulator